MLAGRWLYELEDGVNMEGLALNLETGELAAALGGGMIPKTEGWTRLSMIECVSMLFLSRDRRVGKWIEGHKKDRCPICSCFIGSHTVKQYRICRTATKQTKRSFEQHGKRSG
jgi:hypothetical protein